MNKVAIFILLISSTWAAAAELNLELGVVENSYNKIKIPGDEGTLFNMAPSFDDSNFYHRISYSHKFKSKHGFRLLYAPLKLEGDKVYSKDIKFQGVTFNANEKIYTEYAFNSYRGSYFYQLIDHKDWSLRLGATLKVRDALVELKQDNVRKFKKNTGLVPLFYLASEYKWDKGFRVALDFDGLAAPQGRAFDVALMGGFYFTPKFHGNLGYRMLEGGVDNEKVYNFSQFNYFFSALQYNFN